MDNFFAQMESLMTEGPKYYDTEFQRLRKSRKQFPKYTGVTVKQFDWLAAEILKLDPGKKSEKQTEKCGADLAFTLSFYAQGGTPLSLGMFHNVKNAEDTISKTTPLIFQVLEKFLVVPGKEDCARIAAEFQENYGIPNCNGPIGLKQVEFMERGSDFMDFTANVIQLLATCDKDLRFVFYSLGDVGAKSELVEYKKSTFGKAAAAGQLTPDSSKSPHNFVGGQPYKSCKRVITSLPPGSTGKTENFAAIQALIPQAFKLLSKKWAVLKNTIPINNPDTVRSIIKTLLALHNWLICEAQIAATDADDEEEWETDEEDDEESLTSDQEEEFKSVIAKARMALNQWLRAGAP